MLVVGVIVSLKASVTQGMGVYHSGASVYRMSAVFSALVTRVTAKK